MTPASLTFTSFLREHFAKIFANPWPLLPSALTIGALNVFLFAFDKPWTASDGLRNWGDGLLRLLGVLEQGDLLPPHLYSGSVLNIGVIMGGLIGALVGRQFDVRPAPAWEIIKGAVGGALMGVGAMLAFGCNIGGFFSALSALSFSGAGMMMGLLIGSFVATRLIIRERARQIEMGQIGFVSPCESPPKIPASSAAIGLQPSTGVMVFLFAILCGGLYQWSGHGRLAVLLYFGVLLGVILQRSRFCLVNAFREPFLSGRSEHARAAACALLLSMLGMAILKAADLKDAGEWVFPSFWFVSLLGGTIFGVGMVFAEGCGAGTLWRVGEGHVKLWIALVFFAVSASLTRSFLVSSDWIRRLGSAHFLPDLLSWPGAVVSIATLMFAWYVLAAWNEQRRQIGVLNL